MAIPPISHTSGLVSSFIQGRYDLIDLQRQLATGKKAATYGGLDSSARVTALSLRSEISAIEGYQRVMADVNVRLDVAQQTLTRFNQITDQVKSGAFSSGFELVTTTQTGYQRSADLMFAEMASLLNTDINGRYIFAGRTSDQKPVADAELMLHGDGVRAGLEQLVDERRQADLGASGLGRLAISAPGATTVQLAQEADGLPFGIQLVGATSQAPGVSVTGPAGSPAALDFDFGAQLPTPGQEIRVTMALPDGSTEVMTLTAADTTPLKQGEFAIGADAATTAANFQGALQTELARFADTKLTAASAIQASNEFFDGTVNNPPLRVDGPPFDTATGQIAGTAADTVIWYTGDDSAGGARNSSVAKIDSSVSVAYGMRADEEAVRNAMAKLGVLAVTQFSASDDNASARYQALTHRAGGELHDTPARQSFADMMTELAGVQQSLEQTGERHDKTLALFEGVISEKEDISQEEVATKILALQTRLQASMETTAMLSRLTLTNFL